MLYQVGITAVKLQTGTNPQKKTLLAQPEFLEASNDKEAIVLYAHKMHKEIEASKFDQLEVTVRS